MTRWRRSRASVAARVLAAALLGAGALVAMAPPASAHALLERSVPAGDSIVDHAPSDVRITFTEPPDPVISRIELFDASGAPVEAGGLDRPTRDTLRLALPEPLSEGTYTASWFAVSTVDGHLPPARSRSASAISR